VGELEGAVSGRKGRDIRWIELGGHRCLLDGSVVGKQESVLEVGADGVLDHPFPQHRAQLSVEVLRRVRVFLGVSDMEHAPGADQDAAAGRILHEGHLLRVEEAK
jgi:hypothetical protein